MAALVAALLAQASDRTPWLAARIADRFNSPLSVVAAAAIALAITNGIGGALGAIMAPILTPNARSLLLGFALLSAGISAFWPLKPLEQPGGRRIGAFATALVTLLAAGLGDRTQFLTSAIAARGDLPVFAAIGGTLGALAVQAPIILAGEAVRDRLPLRTLRGVIGALFSVAGAIAVLSAMRLI